MRITKKRLLDYLTNEVYVRVGKSNIHGVGLIAIRDIPKGTDPFKSLYPEEHIELREDEVEVLPPEIRKMVHDYCAEENDTVWIPVYGFNPIHVLHLINHSKEPNVKTLDGGDTFITTRDIKKGEELLSDYSTYDEDFEEKL